jgi:DNA-binding CsgD family transcriptional regulator
MLIQLHANAASLPPPVAIPEWLAGVADPNLTDQSLAEAVTKVISRWGYTTMLYGTARTAMRGGDQRFHFWTTVPAEWVAEYDKNSYVEIDPRIAYGWDTPPPLVWDGSTGANDPRVARFLQRASEFGIGSGLALYLAEHGYSVLFSLNRPERSLTSLDRAHIQSHVGDALHFAHVFHWMFMRRVLAKGVPPAHQGAPLSPREIQCLTHAAHGMTSAEMGVKLGITERTANFHFSNAISKLGVLNRHEAIATAVARGLVEVKVLGDAKRSAYFARRATRKKSGQR